MNPFQAVLIERQRPEERRSEGLWAHGAVALDIVPR
jgi:hypothetical protein